jgi:hypothetical protein
VIEPHERDADSARVEDILRGASRGRRDPDVELFVMVTELERSRSNYLQPFLEQLVRDAYLD